MALRARIRRALLCRESPSCAQPVSQITMLPAGLLKARHRQMQQIILMQSVQASYSMTKRRITYSAQTMAIMLTTMILALNRHCRTRHGMPK